MTSTSMGFWLLIQELMRVWVSNVVVEETGGSNAHLPQRKYFNIFRPPYLDEILLSGTVMYPFLYDYGGFSFLVRRISVVGLPRYL